MEYSSGRIDVGKFLRGEQHKIFRQSRKVRGDAGKREKIIESKIAIADGVQAVGGDAGKSEIVSQGVAIDRKGTAGQSARTHGAGVGGNGSVLQTR